MDYISELHAVKSPFLPSYYPTSKLLAVPLFYVMTLVAFYAHRKIVGVTSIDDWRIRLTKTQ